MSSNVAWCVGDGATLSACILAALEERGEDEVMFALLRRHHPDDSSTVSRQQGSRGVVDVNEEAMREMRITKRTWCAFVLLLKQRFVASPHGQRAGLLAGRAHDTWGDEGGLEDECDVGIYSRETFYACLVESACLCLGWSFCVFRPDDPPLRLQRLELHRRPRWNLCSEDVASLLHEALSTEASGARSGEREVAEAGTGVPGRLPVEQIDDNRVAYYMYTSGSTGDPKCVVASRGNLRAYMQRFIFAKDGLNAVDGVCRFFGLSSPFFDPSIGDMLVGLCTPHGALYTCTQEDLLSGRAASLLVCAQPTHVVSTPAVCSSLTTSGHLPSLLPSSTAPVKVFLGGERMSQELISLWADKVELYNIYGVTEVTIYQSVWRVFPGTRAEHVKCGPGVGTRIRIEMLTAASDELLSDRVSSTSEDGLRRELCESASDDYGGVILYGDQVCCGYAEDSTVSPFGYDPVTGERFFRTGDIGRLAPPGEGGRRELELRGRRDCQLKLNDQRVALEEVEGTVQRALEGLFSQCACFCVKTATGTPTIGAAVVLKDVVGEELLREHRAGVVAALQELLALHLPSFMVPCRWLLLAREASLPQTPTGKVSRAQLAVDAAQDQREELGAHLEEKHDPCIGEEDELCRVARSVWQCALGVPVYCDTHYLHAGGDSLGALKVSRAVYLGLNAGSEAEIDEHGRLPTRFQPCVLLQHPRFGDYVQALREAWLAASSIGASKPESGDTVRELSLPLPPSPALSSAEAPTDHFLREVVAAQGAGIADRLLRNGLANVNGYNSREHRCTTPLHVAVASCCSLEQESATLRVVEVLLQHGARLTAVTPDGVTAAHLASSRSAAVLQRLLDHDQAVAHCRDARQQSLLHFAARGGNVAAARLLHRYDLKLDTRDKWQRTPAHWAVLNGHMSVLEEMALHCASKATKSSAAVATVTTTEPNGGAVKWRRCSGNATARFKRLARKKTHLRYETLHEIAGRVHPADDRVKQLCDILAPAVGEAATTE
ncbi:hypothetical protein LSCM1_03235 [Leishmania martiniquensis]|uniref:AMP-dependent synthetase/ligase domain-containing protein n=1 Tax=Leishmania martiniquensis TaxID=1580590 RepID=A0A836GG64_9TRYP|nr:hypothetical protein LSCM1_03235 [Leishmania martiniquensis]